MYFYCSGGSTHLSQWRSRFEVRIVFLLYFLLFHIFVFHILWLCKCWFFSVTFKLLPSEHCLYWMIWCRSKIFTWIDTYLVSFSSELLDILSDVFWGFLSIVPQLGHDCFCPHISKFIIHDKYYRSGLYRLNTDRLKIMQEENLCVFVLFVHFPIIIYWLTSCYHFSSVIPS
jgi:hypothetical protein